MEAQSVVALRLLKLAGGGASAATESRRMLSEKLEAALTAQAHLAAGIAAGSPGAGARKAQTVYRRKVRANRRRLMKRRAT